MKCEITGQKWFNMPLGMPPLLMDSPKGLADAFFQSRLHRKTNAPYTGCGDNKGVGDCRGRASSGERGGGEQRGAPAANPEDPTQGRWPLAKAVVGVTRVRGRVIE